MSASWKAGPRRQDIQKYGPRYPRRRMNAGLRWLAGLTTMGREEMYKVGFI